MKSLLFDSTGRSFRDFTFFKVAPCLHLMHHDLFVNYFLYIFYFYFSIIVCNYLDSRLNISSYLFKNYQKQLFFRQIIFIFFSKRQRFLSSLFLLINITAGCEASGNFLAIVHQHCLVLAKFVLYLQIFAPDVKI